jgi:long-chain acyl-CoA synthetase
MAFDLASATRAALQEGGETDAVAAGGRWRSWGWIARTAGAIDAALGGVAEVGLIARNRPAHVAAFAANVMAGRTTVMIYSALSPSALASELRQLRLPAVLADRDDWTETLLEAAADSGTAAIAIGDGTHAGVVEVLRPGGPGPHRARSGSAAFELLSSGTTGPPKRVPLSWAAISQAVEGASATYAGIGAGAAVPPQILVHPLGNVAGVAYVAPPLAYGQRLVLLEKFSALAWAEAVRDYRPARGTVPPAGIRMLLDADIPPAWLNSLTLLAVGGGKLPIELQQAFEARFNIPILTAFGATEFGGVIANWNLDLYRAWGKAKRGSAGRASPGVALRIVDPESHEVLQAGSVGLLEAQVPRIGPDFIRTTDLASLDADGFLFLHGRADGAINRGGFKVLPDIVAEALRAHPDVADAAVVGRADARLGEVPVAAVELVPGASAGAAALLGWLKDRLVAYQVPTEIRIMPALPRNASMKVALHEVKALFACG